MRGEPMIGELRTCVTIERDMNDGADPPVQDSTGAPIPDWQTLISARGKVQWSGGDELFEGKQDRSDTSVVAIIRYPATQTLTAKDRMVVDGLTCDIENTPYDLNGRRRWLVIRGVHRG